MRSTMRQRNYALMLFKQNGEGKTYKSLEHARQAFIQSKGRSLGRTYQGFILWLERR